MASARTGIAAGEHAGIGEVGRPRQQDVGWQIGKIAALLDDGDAGRVPLARTQQGALVAVLQHRL